ncbi:MAG: hypothetical protein K2X64_04325, partial [Rhodocyclaceae bacterium]|nr:hypothetical protein [Rhodocyclaceae bacterium]
IRDVNETVKRIGTETRTRRACIENLMKLLTFSIPTFPSLTAIVAQLVNAFIQNLIGKACAAATGAINGAIGQVNDKIRDVQNGVDTVTKPITSVTNQSTQVIPQIPTLKSAPETAQAKSQPTSTWKNVSCKIFGGCE